jgi:hypothetical protein
MALAPDLCGTVLDERYELHALIGEGGFGRVYRGRDRRLARAVAVKVIKPWWAEDPDWAEGFMREARLLAAINDPGIVAIHDIGHGPDGPYYVSELVEGENLAVRLRDGPLSVDRARAIAVGLCRGLAAAHALRIIHRDVKPANVLLTDGAGGSEVPRVKVTDFGVARLAEATSGGQPDSVVAGTPRYMAPEQGRGGVVTPAADVYSAGAVLYEMLSGRPPFDGVSAVQLALAHLSDPPPPLPGGVPADLRRVVARALAKDPADRYVDGAAMARALGAEAVGSAEDPDHTRRSPRRSPRLHVDTAARRRSAALLALALAALGGLIAAAVLLGHDGRGRRPARIAVAAPVEVPLLIGGDATAAVARLRAQHLRARIVAVPAPGIRPGTVTSQIPVAGRTTAEGSSVTLDVSEVPRWRTVTTFSARSSPALHIVGARWRILATAQGAHRCSFLVFCHSTSAVVTAAGSRSVLRRVTLGDGTAAPSVFSTGPGTYQLTVSPASGSTRWSIEVQDDY